MKRDTITGTVDAVRRHGHTYYGNPIMSILVNGAWFRISNDAAIVYGIENTEYRNEPHTFNLTRAGRISHVTR